MADVSLDIMTMDSHDLRLFIIADISTYPDGFNVLAPTLAVTVPGFPKKQIPFSKGEVNILNSKVLQIPCSGGCPLQNLPDGVYTFDYAIFPSYKYNVTKTFFRVDKLYSKFDDKFLTIELLNCDLKTKRNKKMALDEAEAYIQGAIAAGNKCANKLAYELYKKADSVLQQIN